MGDPAGIRVFRPEDRRDASDAATAGMHRLESHAGDGFWLGTVTTEPNVISGWHHHAGYETVIYVLRGTARLDAWVDGEIERHEAPAGSFIRVAAGTIHREGSASADGIEAVLVRAGEGEVTVPVEGLPEGD
jgi:uncharacterized RmlC-like cupin family protein